MSQQNVLVPPSDSTFPTRKDLADIQGDVILGIPKRFEDFLFFTINDVKSFKFALREIIPDITSTQDIINTREMISTHKARGHRDLVKVVAINIAFTSLGLKKLGVTDKLGGVFDAGQFASAVALGDQFTLDANGNPTPKWLDAFKSEIDGVIIVAGDSHTSVKEGESKIEKLFGNSISKVLKVEANARPGHEKGHEHFGFLDGISNPAIPAITGTLPGQNVVQPGVIIVGQEGDPVNNRPDWAINGSFLAYRHLVQLVPEFHKFLHDNPIVLPGLSRKDGSQLLGARFFGRWPSGAPIDITPLQDDPTLAADKFRNNNFDFSDAKDQTRCPFSAHIRKTDPRSDLGEINGIDPETALKPHLMIRQGIAFGPEVSLEEREFGRTKDGVSRGLSFASYQSSLENSFEFVQKNWADNTSFPPKKDANGNAIDAGFDPIIGQNGNSQRTVLGTDPLAQTQSLTLPFDFVVSKGGAYFFVPSISALRSKLSV